MSSTVLITGGTGFIGRVLCGALQGAGMRYRLALRALRVDDPLRDGDCVVGELSGRTDWSSALAGVDAVVHVAGIAHVLEKPSEEVLELYRRVNVDATLALGYAAAKAGVRRFVLVSSARIHGEFSIERPWRESDLPNPPDPYSLSKWEAERGLRQIELNTGMEAVVIRPPLVYGPGVKANFLRLMRWVDAGWPLPFGGFHNRRSLVYVGNLASAIVATLQHPAAAAGTYLVSDEDDVSTAELCRRIGNALGRRARIFPCPPLLLQLMARSIGKNDDLKRLLGNFAVDASGIRNALGWKPPFAMRDGLAETAAWYRAASRLAQ